MSDNDSDFNETNDGGEPDLKDLRRAADQSKAVKAENAALKRELAFTKAGIDSSNPTLAYFVKGYEGELEPSVIRQAAIDAGFIQGQTQSPADQQAAFAQQRVAAVGDGSIPEFDGSGPLLALEKAYAEGGVKSVLEVAQQYGVPVNTGPIGPTSY
jgi:hypothetical protein